MLPFQAGTVQHACTLGLQAYAGDDSTLLGVIKIEAMDAQNMKAGPTDLAKAWERDSTVRRRAAVYTIVLWLHIPYHATLCIAAIIKSFTHTCKFEVKMPPSGCIDRDAIELNEELLKPVILILGARVGVDVLETHLLSLYELMALPLSSTSPILVSMHCMYPWAH